jgi:phosphatidylinositol alpha-1,6-mannosyltransferase
MDVFALPYRSRWMGLEAEGLGILFLEAAASGLPLVVGPQAVHRTVGQGASGFVVRNRTQLIEALELLVSDRPRASVIGKHGRARMEKEYSWDSVIARLIAGCEEATTNRRRLLTPFDILDGTRRSPGNDQGSAAH